MKTRTLTTLTEEYDVFPHGIVTVDESGVPVVYAVFKMIVSIEEMSKASVSGEINYALWKDLAGRVDANKWCYQIDFASASGQLILAKKTSNPQQGFSDLKFNIKSENGETELITDCFNYGKRKVSGKPKDTFDFIETRTFYFSEETETKDIKQFDNAPPATVLSNVQSRQIFSDVLKKSAGYAADVSVKTKDIPGLNFKAVYASIMDDPFIGERYFGVIREFRIKISEFGLGNDGEYPYSIRIGGSASGEYYAFRKKEVARVPKYYNGLKRILFNVTQNAGYEGFERAELDTVDPYKKALEEKDLHPDGIYGIVKYHQNGDSIMDPFNNPAEPVMKGFNVLFKPEDRPAKSLSIHKTKVKFHDGNRIEAEHSGHLIARAEMKTDKGEKYRNNVLFAWRGDNLIVNRKKESPPTNGEEKSNEKEKGTSILEENQYCEEDEFVRSHLFTKEEHLIDKTQLQLLLFSDVSVYIRSVSTTGHYLPSISELFTESPNTLTFEDIQKETFVTPLAIKSKPIPDSQTGLPIKSPTIIGTKTYDNDSDFVDQEKHMVLNKIISENEEVRYIFPPQIKLEDFSIIGNMTPDQLTIKGKAKPSIKEYKKRCKRLESRMQNALPKLACQRHHVCYLADTRAESLYIYPADLYTAKFFSPKMLSAFVYSASYPFFADTHSTKVSVKRSYPGNQIEFTGKDNVTNVTANLANGVYNFNVYAVNKDFGVEPVEIPKQFNASPLRVSTVEKPEEPFQEKPNPVIRHTGSNNMFWYSDLEFKEFNESPYSWKSLKYQEITEVLKIQHENVDKLLKHYYHENKNVTKEEFLSSEYPYEIFIAKEGTFDKKSLTPSIYPSVITIEYEIPDKLKGKGTFFRLKLNDNEFLEASYNGADGTLQLENEEKDKDQTTPEPPSTNFLAGRAFNITIGFDSGNNRFFVSVLDPVKKMIKRWEVTSFINPENSVNDIEISEDSLRYIQHKVGKLEFRRSNKYMFISDIGTSYSRKKEVKLFASSAFQAYFPKSKTEFDMGTVSSTSLIYEIPNNNKPLPPIVQADVLLMHTTDDCWKDKESYNIKQSKTENIIKLSLQCDFMLEGKNKLGIIISKKPVDPSKTVVEEVIADVSQIGEDITKLSSIDWSGNNLKDILDLKNPHPVLQKYVKETDSKYYQIGNFIYEILECDPYYNIESKKWQVVLPFVLFQSSEVMFAKIVCVKVSPGHSKTRKDPNSANSFDNPIKDEEETNISIFSEPVQLPLYSRKRITIKKTGVEEKKSYTIKAESLSSSKDKFYCIMMNKEKPDWSILNFLNTSTKDTFESLVPFHVIDETPNGDIKKILAIKDSDTVSVSREKCKSILVLEFEIHSNSAIKSKTGIWFEQLNPLFDIRGIRLINVAEFEV
jgi:hypothetical protein